MKTPQNSFSGGWVVCVTLDAVLVSICAVLLAVSFNLKAGATPVFINLFVVTTTADHNDFNCDTDCTLREAIQAANTTLGNSVISFSIPTTDSGYSNGVWTITLSSALPSLNTSNGSSNLSISGPGADKLGAPPRRDPTARLGLPRGRTERRPNEDMSVLRRADPG